MRRDKILIGCRETLNNSRASMPRSQRKRSQRTNPVQDQEVRKRRRSTRKRSTQEGKGSIQRANKDTKGSTSTVRDLDSTKKERRKSTGSIRRESIAIDHRADDD